MRSLQQVTHWLNPLSREKWTNVSLTSQNRSDTAPPWSHVMLHHSTACRPLFEFTFGFSDVNTAMTKVPLTSIFLIRTSSVTWPECWLTSEVGKKNIIHDIFLHPLQWDPASEGASWLPSYLDPKMPLVYFIRSHWMIHSVKETKRMQKQLSICEAKQVYWGRNHLNMFDYVL